MNANLDRKRITLFLALAFGIAWAVGLVLFLNGGLVNSPEVIPGTGITLALVLLASLYMWAPALANILTRLITRQGWQDAGLRLNFKRGWPYWLLAIFLPGLLTILGLVVYFLVFPQRFDAGLVGVRAVYEQRGMLVPENLWLVAIMQTLLAMLISPLINSVATFGEEFGWRGYLQPMLMGLGARKAMLWMGLIWGLWHAPVIAMGHNYGLEYPGAPWLGILMMIVFTFAMGTLLGWLTVRGGSVWPAVLGHAAINGIAALGAMFHIGPPVDTLVGPMPTGLLAMVPALLVALWLLWRANLWQPAPATGAAPKPIVPVPAD